MMFVSFFRFGGVAFLMVTTRHVAQVFALVLDQIEREQRGGIVAALTSQGVEV